MATANPFRMNPLIIIITFFLFFIQPSISSADQPSLVVAQPTSLQLSPGLLVRNSPGAKPGTSVFCERVRIQGLSRVQGLRKYFHSTMVKITNTSSGVREKNIEVCFHRNATLGVGMCPQSQWAKLVKGSWVRPMSPFDHKLLDIRIPGSSVEPLEVSIELEFHLYRVIFLVTGIVLLMSAASLSNSLVFYYGSAMTIGVILMVLMILFQGMKLLPTGRRNSLAIFLYSSIVGLGSFILRYLPGLFRSFLVEIGIGEDMYYPLAIFFLVFVVLAGAWLGFWVVRKLVLTEDGSIDFSVSLFVAWSIRIVASVMILQSTPDPLLAAEALICGIILSRLRIISRPRFLRRIYKNLFRTTKRSRRIAYIADGSPFEDSDNEDIPETLNSKNSTSLWRRNQPFSVTPCKSVLKGLNKTPQSQLADSETFLSSFHVTPEKKKFSKAEWEKFTKDSTRQALEGLVSSPDFSKWAVANAERITLTPKKDTPDRQRRSYLWF